MKKSNLLLVIAAPLLITACGSNSCGDTSSSINPETSSSEDVSKDDNINVTLANKPLIQNQEGTLTHLPVFFVNGVKNIPYFDVSSTLSALVNVDLSIVSHDGLLTATQPETKGTITVNSADNTVTFSDYFAIFGNISSPNYATSEADPDYFKQTSVTYEGINGSTEKKVDFDDYGLEIYKLSDMILMPAASFFDLFVPHYKLVYNGNLFYINSNVFDRENHYALTEYGELVKNVPDDYVYDSALRDFTYKELCMSLDYLYEMSELRGYPSFTKLLVDRGIKDIIYSGEPSTAKFDEAMIQLFNVLLTDYGHTLIYCDGADLFEDNPISRDNLCWAQKMKDNDAVYDVIEAKKKELGIADRHLITDYVATDKTYVLSFDEFSWFEETEDEDNPYDLYDGESAASIVYQANKYIQEHKDSIDNVVIDLSMNGGGEDQAELYVSSWIHGKATQRMYASRANLKAESDYIADVNIDGVYDSNDNIADKKVFVITSNYSYSNGNVLPGEVKGLDNVTLIGQTTGGGSCNVVEYTTAIGNKYRLSTLTRAVNKDWDSIETGVEPDIVLTDPTEDCDYASIISKYIATK